MRIISFYSDTDGRTYYSEHAARLKAKCVQLGLVHTIEKLESHGDYWKNCLRKPQFILDCYERFSEPLIWLDCDTDLVSAPVDLNEQSDIIAFKIPWPNSTVFMHSFAVYFGRTESVKNLLVEWKDNCAKLALEGKKIGDHGPLCDMVRKNPELKQTWFNNKFALLGMSPVSIVPSKRGCETYVRTHTDARKDNHLKSVVTTPLKGGLGNILFQIVMLESHGARTDMQPIYTHSSTSKRYEFNFLKRVPFSEKVLPPMKIHKHNDFHFAEVPRFFEPTAICGLSYFQSEKYFDRDIALDLFSPTSEDVQRILGKLPDISDCVSIHVRRGDYLTCPGRHPTLPVSYYTESAALFPGKKFLVFSDDLKWCELNLSHIPNLQFVYGLSDFEEIWAMSLCSSNIIANSSFSWWGAYLNLSETKTVVAPKLWFGPELKNLNQSDIIPPAWTKL